MLGWIEENVLKDPITADTVFLEDQLDRYVSVNLTRAEVETLAAEMSRNYGADSPAVYRMFSNSKKKALIKRLDPHGAGPHGPAGLQRLRPGDHLGGAGHGHRQPPSPFPQPGLRP